MPIQIFVKLPGGKNHALNVEISDSVYKIKQLIEVLTDLPTSEQRLIYNAKQMQDKACIDLYNIRAGCTIHVIPGRLNGGGLCRLFQFS